MKTELGFLGLGQIGAVLASRLIQPDVRLHVFDPRSTADASLVASGAIAHRSPRSVADHAEIVFASLPGAEASMSVMHGEDNILAGRTLRCYVEMSTIGRTAMEAIAKIGCVDAPVTGGVPAALAGRLSIMASGPDKDLALARPWLECIGGSLTVLGDRAGQAQTMKLICNLVVAANVAATAEGLVMGTKAGLGPKVMLDLLNSGTARSAASSDILTQAALARTFGFGARLSIIDKDARLGLSEAAGLGVETPMFEAAARQWAEAIRAGWGDEDFTSILRFVEERARVVVGSVPVGELSSRE